MSQNERGRRTKNAQPQGGPADREPRPHGVFGGSSSADDKPSDTATLSRAGSQRVCEGSQKNGKPCGLISTLRTIEGGWRCRHHRKGLTVHGADPVDTPPSTKFRSKADAEKYMSWVLAMGARGRLNAAQVNALLKAVGMWHKVEERAEKDVREAFDQLLEQMRLNSRLLVKAREAYEESDGDRAEAIESEIAELRQEIKAELQLIRAGGRQEREDHNAA